MSGDPGLAASSITIRMTLFKSCLSPGLDFPTCKMGRFWPICLL